MLKWIDVLSLASKGTPVPDQRFNKSDEEWSRELTPEQFRIMRKKGTEAPFSGEYCESHVPGKYACACCGTLLFDSSLKFDSGTGWPSFNDPVPCSVETTTDRSYGMVRTEVHCAHCGSHLGHVFPDGPPPTGLRYCINATVLTFIPDEA